jgi:hypothetical protein
MENGLKPVWAGRPLRLNPFRFPQAVTYAAHGGDGDVTFTINERGAVMRRWLSLSALPISVALPARAFKGVAARAVEDDAGEITVTLELLHNDPQLSVPLLVAHDLEDVAADWRAWSEAFGLPMLLVEVDGVARALDATLGDVKVSSPKERRQGRASYRRRPRFLARRRTGGLGLRLVIEGDEIIARR